jgi:hypothetical protein
MNVSVPLNFEFKHISAQTAVKNITVVIVGVTCKSTIILILIVMRTSELK